MNLKNEEDLLDKDIVIETIIDMSLSNPNTFDVLSIREYSNSYNFRLGYYLVHVIGLTTLKPKVYVTLSRKFVIAENDRRPSYYELDLGLLRRVRKIMRRCLETGSKSEDLKFKPFKSEDRKFIRHYELSK